MSKNQKSTPPVHKATEKAVDKPAERVAAAAPQQVVVETAAPKVAAPVEAPPVAAPVAVVKATAAPQKPVAASALVPLFDFSRKLVAQVEQQGSWWLSHGIAPVVAVGKATAVTQQASFVAAKAMMRNVELLFGA